MLGFRGKHENGIGSIRSDCDIESAVPAWAHQDHIRPLSLELLDMQARAVFGGIPDTDTPLRQPCACSLEQHRLPASQSVRLWKTPRVLAGG